MLNAGVDMKVITEERLILLRNNLAETGKNKEACLIDYLITDVLKEIDILTVSKLRPIVDAPIDDETILCVGERYNTFLKVYFDGVYYKDDHDDLYDKGYFIGWIPMPIYKPEEE